MQDKSGAILPKNLRFQSRRQKLLACGVEFAGWVGVPKKEECFLPLLLQGVKKRPKIENKNNLSPLELAKLLGQTENVEFFEQFIS